MSVAAADPMGASSPDDADFQDCDSVDARRMEEESIQEDSPAGSASVVVGGSRQKGDDREHERSDNGEVKQEKEAVNNGGSGAGDAGESPAKGGHSSTDVETPTGTKAADGMIRADGVELGGKADVQKDNHDRAVHEGEVPDPVSAIPVMPPPSDSSVNENGFPPLGEDPVETEKKMKKQMTWGETWRTLTLAPRAAGVMMKVPIRRMFRKPKRRTWNTQMETYVSVMRSAGKNAPRHDLRAVRAIANTTVPNVLLPSGVFRCKQYIAFQERDMGNRLHQPVKIGMPSDERSINRDQSSHVLKECPTAEELQHNTVILYVHGGGFCMCSSGTHRHLLYTLALKTEECILLLKMTPWEHNRECLSGRNNPTERIAIIISTVSIIDQYLSIS
ncbi:hypothetical protein FOZ60_007566 [Perkinsus olseni]|uniref:Uncharacterized protein n=1 Tax=Perkinsus olseni TaxID=32597 RepID=A0A7J6PFQ6_PEROL|nr:hypothetical protein FOZ60_007566 [Perkinsus olseni]